MAFFYLFITQTSIILGNMCANPHLDKPLHKDVKGSPNVSLH